MLWKLLAFRKWAGWGKKKGCGSFREERTGAPIYSNLGVYLFWILWEGIEEGDDVFGFSKIFQHAFQSFRLGLHCPACFRGSLQARMAEPLG